MVKGFTAIEEIKQRLRDIGTLSHSRTPQDALEYIEQLEYNNRKYALEVLSALGQAQEAYEAQVELKEQLQESQDWTNYWAKLWERSSTLLMQHHPAFNETTSVPSKDKIALVKELFGDDLLVKVDTIGEETEDAND